MPIPAIKGIARVDAPDGRIRCPVALALNILLGHLVGDFLLQPGWMVAAKRRGLAGLLTHTGVIILCTGVVVIRELHWLWALTRSHRDV